MYLPSCSTRTKGAVAGIAGFYIKKKKKKAGRSKKHQVETFRVGVRREEPRYRVSLDRMYFEMLKGATYSYVFL